MRKMVLALGVAAMSCLAAPAMAVDADNNGVHGDEPTYQPQDFDGDVLRDGHIVAFPTSGDTWEVDSFPYWWHVGDTVYGVHDPDMGSVDQAEITLYLDYSSLTPGCGYIDMEFRIDGVTVGEFTITPEDGLGPIVRSFDFDPMTPPFELRYYELNQVVSGCGSVQINPTGLCEVEFGGGGTPTETTSWSQVKSFYR